MASTKALDDLWQVQPPPTAKKLRELVYSAFMVEDHYLHFFFLGGLQFNWAWAQRLDYTQFVPIGIDPTTGFIEWEPTRADTGNLQMDFYIIYDW